jgi:CBS domain containing-hemolysin-like protein
VLGFSYLFYPVPLALDFIGKIVNMLGPAAKESIITEEELRTIVKASEGEGSINTEEGEMIHRVLELNDTTVDEVMTPRPDMYAIEWTSKIKDVLPEIIDSGFSRIPVYAKRVDKTKGIVYVKDILNFLAGDKGETMLRDIVKPALFVPGNMLINSMLKLFKKKKRHIAMVVDEYGGVQGLVTIEDILEELVGEIYDESDIPEALITKVNGTVARVSGKAPLEDVNESLGLALEENDDYETISGFVLYKLGRIPNTGEEVELDALTIRVERVEDNRIKELTIIKKEMPEPLT